MLPVMGALFPASLAAHALCSPLARSANIREPFTSRHLRTTGGIREPSMSSLNGIAIFMSTRRSHMSSTLFPPSPLPISWSAALTILAWSADLLLASPVMKERSSGDRGTKRSEDRILLILMVLYCLSRSSASSISSPWTSSKYLQALLRMPSTRLFCPLYASRILTRQSWFSSGSSSTTRSSSACSHTYPASVSRHAPS